MEAVNPAELRAAARVCDGLVYVAGLAGVVAGALLFRDGNVPFAVVAWTVTFIAGAVLRLAAWGARGIAQLLESSRRLEAELAHLARQKLDEDEPPPYRGWH